ncbi:MAG: hypothetical protein ICV77_07315 [Cyanobacteria bacterium Co-bin8]|nr:hypothetical protein [Cyanobacteria bacterium Co-bin8]
MANLPKGRRNRSKSAGWLRRQGPKRLPPGGEVRLLVRSHPPSRPWLRGLSLLLIALMLWGAMTLLVFSLRLGFQLMVNPEALPWLQSGLLVFNRQAELAETVTLEALEVAIAAEGQQLGEPLRLRDAKTETDFWLLPVQANPTQATDPANILELRLYRLVPELPVPLLSPVASFPVTPLDDEVVLAPLRNTPQKIDPTRQPFPLTNVTQLTPFPTEGFWLMLQGQWQRSGTTLRYGQLVYFDPRRQALESLIRWSTPTSRLPRWTDLDGVEPADLLIDETVGLEPAFRGYRLQRRQGLGPAVQLLPITLDVPADMMDSDGAYYRALSQSRSGLWSAAFKQLKALKPRLAQKWTPAAEAQLKLVQLHADLTQQQAERRWSVPSQQILASLIDGRWEAALKQLEAAPEAQEALMRTLANEEGRFWNRITAALRGQAKDPAALVWGGLILKAQQDQQTALTWLNEQKASAAARSRFVAVANPPVRLAQSPQNSAAVPVSAATSVNRLAVQALMGAATGLPTVDLAQWQPWETSQAMKLAAAESWYEIAVVGWQLAGSWSLEQQGSEPWIGTTPAALKQSLALALPELSLLPQTGQGAEIRLRVRGLRLNNGRLKLLAVGSGQATGLAYSTHSLLRLNAADGSSAIGNGAVAAALQSQIESFVSVSTEDLAALLAGAPLHALDVTGDGQQEWLLTLPSPVLDKLTALVGCDGLCEPIFNPRAAAKTLIVSSEGQILYSDLFLPQTLAALTQPQPSQPVALLVEQSNQYWFQTYASERQQFD